MKISRIENIELLNKEKSNEITKKSNNNNLLIIKKENDIKILGNNNSNSINRKNSFHENIEKSKNINPFSLIDKKKDELELNKTKTRESKNTERRYNKSSILLTSNSSEKQGRKIDLDKKEDKKINKYEKLIQNFEINNNKLNKPIRITKNNNKENNSNKNKNIRKNNALKNKIESQYLYTDRETNESRALFKKYLKTINKLTNEEISLSKNEINKVKMNKAKIRKFKSKNLLNDKQRSSGNKKSTNLNNKKFIDKTAKIKHFNKQKNFNSDYINNSNIILQNTTVNHTTYNYYLNSQDRLNRSSTNKK